jgi:hypothetical protein
MPGRRGIATSHPIHLGTVDQGWCQKAHYGAPPDIPPETRVDVPTEFVNVTETEPSALVSPENANGTCKLNDPPAAWPAVLPNHAVAIPLNGTVTLVPDNCAPAAAEKVNVALARSRDVELWDRYGGRGRGDIRNDHRHNRWRGGCCRSSRRDG